MKKQNSGFRFRSFDRGTLVCKVLVVVLTGVMIVSGVPTTALPEASDTAAAVNSSTESIVTQSDSSASGDEQEVASESGEQATEEAPAEEVASDQQEEAPAEQVTDETSSTDESAVAPEPSEEATPAETPAVTDDSTADQPVDVSLQFDHAYITYLGQTVASPTTSISVPAGKSITFTATADEGYEISSVKAILDGNEIAESSNSGAYTIDGSLIQSGLQVVVEAQEKAVDPTTDQTDPASPITTDTVIGDNTDSSATTDAATTETATTDSAVTTPTDEGLGTQALPEGAQTVTFINCGSKYMTEYIASGKYAVAPDDPAATGTTPANSKFLGWSMDGSTIVDVSTVAITAPTTFTAVYSTPSTYTITINYVYDDSSHSAAAQPFQVVVDDGASYTNDVVSPEVAGFHIKGTTSDKTVTTHLEYANVTENKAVTVTYTGDPSYYTVKYEFEQVDGSYAEDSSILPASHLTGPSGAQTEATADPVAGFTVEPITQATIVPAATADYPGQTVVTVKYDRTSYLVNFNSDGGSYVAPASYKYGTTVTAPENPTKLGYTFQGWDTTGDGTVDGLPSTMPANDVAAKAVWKENETASYTVVYWQQNINDDKSTLTSGTQTYDYSKSAVVSSATVGSDVTPSTADQVAPEGFAFNSEKSASVTVKSDGSTVLNVYYDRQLITFNFYTDSSKSTACNPAGDTISPTLSYAYTNMPEGATMTGLFGQPLSKYGYTWPTIAINGVANASMFIDLQEGSYTTFLTSFISRNNGYTTHDFYVPGSLTFSNTIMHWKQNTDGTYSADPSNQTGAQSNTTWNFSNKYSGFTVSYYNIALSTDSVALPVADDYTGWTSCSPQSAVGITLTKDGTTYRSDLTLRILYTRNKYTVSYLNPDGSTALATSAPIYYEGELAAANPNIATGKTAAQAGLTKQASNDDDYLFEGWYLDPECTKAVDWSGTMAASNLAVYAKWVKPSYTVTFNSNGGDSVASQTVEKYDTIDVPTPTKEGYTFRGWYLDAACKQAFVSNTQITGNMTLYAKWTKVGSEEYTAYYKNAAGEYFSDTAGNTTTDITKAYTTTGTGDIGTSVNVAPIAIEGYYPASGSISLVITANAADNVVTFQYKNATTWNYTVECYDEASGELIQTKTVATYNEQEIFYPEGIAGYMLASDYRGYSLSSGSNTLKLYYTKDPAFTVTYDWGTDVPDGVTLPVDATIYARGQMVTINPTYTEGYLIKDGTKNGVEGYWTFSGWDQQDYAANGNMIIRGSWTFTPKTALTITALPATLVYDGELQTAKSFQTSSLVQGDVLDPKSITYAASGTDAGTYDGTFTGTPRILDASGNDVTYRYNNITTVPSTLTITPMPVTITVNANKVYDGVAMSLAGTYAADSGIWTSTALASRDHIESVIASGSQTDVGVSPVAVSNAFIEYGDGYDSTANYVITYVGTLTVTPAPLTVTTPSADKPYDGSALTATNGTLSGLVNGETATLSVTGSQTDVGSSTNTYAIAWGTAKQSNYTITESLGTLTVTGTGTPTVTPTPTGTPTPPAPVTTVATALQNAYQAAIGEEPTPLAAPSEESITDSATPLAVRNIVCWVHWYLLLGMVATLIYGLAVLFRRHRFTSDLKHREDDVLNGNTDEETEGATTPAGQEG